MHKSLIAVALLYFAGCQFGFGASVEPNAAIASSIQRKFDAALSSMTPQTQEHYAVRMYRVTGDDRYLYPIMLNLRIAVRNLTTDYDSLECVQYRKRRTQELMAQYEGDDRKSRMRRDLLAKRGDMSFYLNLLYVCNKISDYKIADPELSAKKRALVDSLQNIDFASFLLDTATIRIFAAQAVNYVYYLRDLGIADVTQEYMAAFRRVFPDDDEGDLTPLEFRDKIYGLTHIVLAASRYYQRPVARNEFLWIFAYFENNISDIITETKPDIIAEVGLCFLLAGELRNPLVERCRDAVREAFDRKKGIILSPSGKDNLEAGEHRNVLAYMIFAWPEMLHPGPDLGSSDVLPGPIR